VGEMRQSISLRKSSLVRHRLVAAGERYRLEREEGDAPGVVHRELNDFSDLLVVDAVNDGRNRNDLHAVAMQVFDCAKLDVEQIADRAMVVRGIADSVELQIYESQSCFSGLFAEFSALGELDSVGCRLHAVVTDLARVTNCIKEVWGEGW